MLENFGNKHFLTHQVQEFDQLPLVAAYKTKEKTFLKTVPPVPKVASHLHLTLLNSHVLYEVKRNDDRFLKLRACIGPHGNENSLKDLLS